MIKIKNTKVYGLEESIIRSSYPYSVGEPQELLLADVDQRERSYKLGHAKQGSGHDCFLKGIIVNFDLRYSLYFIKQLQRYHFIDFISSQSTMHSMLEMNIEKACNKYVHHEIINLIKYLIKAYKKEPDKDKKYKIFMKIISNTPAGFEYWAGMTTNYLQLKSIYNQRYNHKLKEDWGYFCNWIEELPYFRKLVFSI